jgi:long-chain acyl-CoA synthetase
VSERTRASVLKELTAAEQPYELVPGSVFDRPCLRFKNAPPTLRDLFSQSRSEVEFIIYEDQRLTFDEAYIEASKIAMILVNDYGVKQVDRVDI